MLTVRTLTVSAVVCVLAAILQTPGASALSIAPSVYSGTTITGSDAIETPPAGHPPQLFGAEKVGIDQSSGTVYAASSERIYAFDAATKASAPFSALGGKTVITEQPVYSNAGDMEVDNTGTATQGRVYAFTEQQAINVYMPTGEKAAFVSPFGTFCGAAIGPSGNLWLNQYNSELVEYKPTGQGTGRSLPLNGFGTPAEESCEFAIDTKGYFYISTSRYGSGVVRKYTPDGKFEYTLGTGSAAAVVIDPSNDDVYVDEGSKVERYSSSGTMLGTFGEADGPYEGLQGSRGLAIDAQTDEIFVANRNFEAPGLDVFEPGTPVQAPDIATKRAVPTPTTASLRGTVDPDGVKTKDCLFQWGAGPATTFASYPNTADCAEGDILEGTDALPVSAGIAGLVKGNLYHFRLVVENDDGVKLNGVGREFRAQGTPIVVAQYVSRMKGDVARINAELDPDQGDTTYYFEYGEDTSYGTKVPIVENALASFTGIQEVGVAIQGLEPDTDYHFRVVATNDAGTTGGADKKFHTFPPFDNIDPCPNALARQQTGAILLGDCRAFELVSAENTGGYNVESSVVPGQAPLPAFPSADGRVLYGVHNGGIPGTGSPTNKGVDPYVATRSETGWTTTYVGIPADGTPSTVPFASTFLTADQGLRTFAFLGPEICAPCFADGSSGVPIRLPNGDLVQGMAGSIAQPGADPVGFVAKPVSDDGTHFIFAADKKFEPAGKDGSVSIYDRNLTPSATATQVVSTLPDGTTMGGEVGELDVSADGSRVVVGQGVSVDSAGNHYWHPYLHIGTSSSTVDLAPGTTSGVLFAGMSSDGSKVLFTTKDKLLGADEDAGADLYQATVGPAGGPAVLSLLSAPAASPAAGNVDACDPMSNADGNHWNAVGAASPAGCGVVAIGGGGGVAQGDGTVYFLSPEKLDGSGTLDEPNLFVSEDGGPPSLVTTFDPDDPLVRESVADSELGRRDLFQTTSHGDYAVFSVTAALTGFDSHGKLEVFRYDSSSGQVVCASCPSSGARPEGDARLTEEGLSLSDDGRVFFTTPEPLVLRDTGEREDVYEWAEGDTRLISSGSSPFDAGLLSVSADGRDAYFFTRDTFVKSDQNGTLMKLYDAREKGGFFIVPEPPPCAASDECHGPSSPKPPVQTVGSFAGSAGNHRTRPCGKGKVRKRGKCVAKKRKPHKSGRGR